MKTIVLLLALLAAPLASAQDAPAPAPAPAVDPLAAGTWGHGWFGVETVYSPEAPAKNLGVGWVEGQVGFGRLALASTAGVVGTLGQLNLEQPSTFAAFRGQLAAHYNVLGRPGATCGLAGAVEYTLPLQTKYTVAHPVTAGAGAVCSGERWRAYALAGQDAQMPGFAAIAYAHFPLSERVSWVVRASVGARQTFVASLDVVVRTF